CAHLYRAVSRFIIRRAARSTLFPYTTLFRSGAERRRAAARQPRCRINDDLSNMMSLFMHLCLDGSLSDVCPFPDPSGPFSTDLALTFSTPRAYNVRHEDSRSRSYPRVLVPSRHWDSALHPGLRRCRHRHHYPPQRDLRGPRGRRHGVPVLRHHLRNKGRSTSPWEPRASPHLKAYPGL